MPNQIHTGFLEEKELNPKDWRMGGVTGIDHEILKEDGDWTDFLPVNERQGGVYFDTKGCVSFSALNCIEILAKFKGIDWNKSDRFIAKESGTTKRGNYLTKVAETIRKIAGTVPEESWPWYPKQRQPIYEWEDFYAEVDEEVKMEGKRWLEDWEVKWEWLPVYDVKELLKYGAIQVTVQAWPKENEDGSFSNTGAISYNHAVTLFKADDYYYILDHYEHRGSFIKKLPLDYKFGHALLFTLTKKKEEKDMPIIDIPNNTLVQEVEEKGVFGIHLDGKIIVDYETLLLATWLMRNDGDVKGKTQVLTKEQWDGFPKRDLKGNDL